MWLGGPKLIASYSFSVLPALSLDGILAVKIVEGSFTTERFKDFIDGLLDHMNPFPGPNSVIVMDNCLIHRARSIREMIEERSVMVCLHFLHANKDSQWNDVRVLTQLLPRF